MAEIVLVDPEKGFWWHPENEDGEVLRNVQFRIREMPPAKLHGMMETHQRKKRSRGRTDIVGFNSQAFLKEALDHILLDWKGAGLHKEDGSLPDINETPSGSEWSYRFWLPEHYQRQIYARTGVYSFLREEGYEFVGETVSRSASTPKESSTSDESSPISPVPNVKSDEQGAESS